MERKYHMIKQKEKDAIQEVLNMYLESEERNYWEWSEYTEKDPPGLQMDEIDKKHIYYHLRLLQELLNRIK